MEFDSYEALIQHAVGRLTPDGYTETHHIIPRCMGGSDDESNLVALTAQEHYQAHMLLAIENPAIAGLQYAWFMMTTLRKCGGLMYTATKEEFECARMAATHFMSESRKGTTTYRDTSTGINKRFRVGEQPVGWVGVMTGRSSPTKGSYWSDDRKLRMSKIVTGTTNYRNIVTGEIKRFPTDQVPDGWVGIATGYGNYRNIDTGEIKRFPVGEQSTQWVGVNSHNRIHDINIDGTNHSLSTTTKSMLASAECITLSSKSPLTRNKGGKFLASLYKHAPNSRVYINSDEISEWWCNYPFR